MKSMSADHFIPANYHLLIQYCRHVVEARRIEQFKKDYRKLKTGFSLKTYAELQEVALSQTKMIHILSRAMRSRNKRTSVRTGVSRNRNRPERLKISGEMRPPITQDAICAYRRAIDLHNAPLPADPAARQLQAENYYQACEALRVALGRGRHRVPILDTVGSDDVLYFIVGRGPAFMDDWRGAIAIPKELARLAREMAG